MDNYDVVVIGGGPGGYVAAIRASQLGLKVVVVEKDKMGGVCLNWGCIPTKALLKTSHLRNEILNAQKFGLHVELKSVNMEEIVAHSRNVASKMANGVDFLMKKNKIPVINGYATIKDRYTVSIADKTIMSKYIIIATGAKPKPLPFLPFDGKKILSSKDAMLQTNLPTNLAIIGAGAIGIEYADIYSSLGSKVTIIEAMPNLLPNEDEEISKILERSFKKRGIEFLTKSKLKSVKINERVDLTIDSQDNKEIELSVDKVIVGIGIQPNTEGLNLEEVGILLDSKGFIDCNKSNYRTKIENIYAVGDCIDTPWLAHVASSEGIRAVEDISIREGNQYNIQQDSINYNIIPGCTYCHPEVASVGYTELEAISEGYEIDLGKIPLTSNGKAQAMLETEGMVKIIRNKADSSILGAHIIGPNATELINEYVLAMNMELRAEDIGRTMHAHPTVAESLMEAAEASLGHAIHI